MKELIPLNWQPSIERLRDNLSGAFERYLSKFKRNNVEDSMTWSPISQSIERGIELDETDDALIARGAPRIKQ